VRPKEKKKVKRIKAGKQPAAQDNFYLQEISDIYKMINGSSKP